MSKIHIKFMNDEAIETLRSNIPLVTTKLKQNSTSSLWLTEVVGDDIYVTKKYEVDDFELKVPNDEKDREIDFENSIIIYERLKDLPLYILTDERFWCWMNFDKGYQVALKYMPVEKGKAIFKDHWLFTQGKRRGLFFGVLSRCYFRVALTVDETLADPYEYTRFVIEKPERFRNLSWRAFSSEKKIVLGTLKAEKRVLNEFQIEERTEYFTELAKEISKLGSVMLLDVMEEKDIEDYVYKKYRKMIEVDMKERGLFSKLKGMLNR